jgi:hypothetical protein
VIFVVALGAIVLLAGILGFSTRRRGKGFYPENSGDAPGNVSERLTHTGERTIQDDTFNRRYR